MTVVEFLLARIAEDEKEASARSGTAYAHWRYEPDAYGRPGGRVVGQGKYTEIANDWSSQYHPAAYINISAHIARWAPDRVLAECAAKRRIIAVILEADAVSDAVDTIEISSYVVEDLLKALAQPYAGHPDFDASWSVGEQLK